MQFQLLELKQDDGESEANLGHISEYQDSQGYRILLCLKKNQKQVEDISQQNAYLVCTKPWVQSPATK